MPYTSVQSGAKFVIVVDPVEFKRETALKFGATHAFATAAEAAEKCNELSWGQGADQAIITVGRVDAEVVTAAFNIIGKGSTVVVTGLADPTALTINVSGAEMTLMEKTIRGSLFGSCNPQTDIVKLLRMWNEGKYELDALITERYTLEQINDAYEDLQNGKLIRGVITHSTS